MVGEEERESNKKVPRTWKSTMEESRHANWILRDGMEVNRCLGRRSRSRSSGKDDDEQEGGQGEEYLSATSVTPSTTLGAIRLHSHRNFVSS